MGTFGGSARIYELIWQIQSFRMQHKTCAPGGLNIASSGNKNLTWMINTAEFHKFLRTKGRTRFREMKFTMTKHSQQCLRCQANLGRKPAHLLRPKNG